MAAAARSSSPLRRAAAGAAIYRAAVPAARRPRHGGRRARSTRPAGADRRQSRLLARHLGARRGRADGVRRQARGRALAAVRRCSRELQRSVFVDRERRQKTGDVNREIAAAACRGDPVVLFAEGTSSDGNRVLPFRSALIGAVRGGLRRRRPRRRARSSRCRSAYTRQHGLPMGRQMRPLVAWYGDMDFLPHLAGVPARAARSMQS